MIKFIVLLSVACLAAAIDFPNQYKSKYQAIKYNSNARYTVSNNQYSGSHDGRYSGSNNGRYSGNNDGRYNADNSGSYRNNDGRYNSDNSGAYVHQDNKYNHDDEKYKHLDDKYKHVGEKYGHDSHSGHGSFSGHGSGSVSNIQGSVSGSSSGTVLNGFKVDKSHQASVSNQGSLSSSNFGISKHLETPGSGHVSKSNYGSAEGKYDNRNYRIIRKEEHVDEDGYHYLYETENGITGEEQGKLANRGTDEEAMRAHGFYTYTGPDNVVYTVRYTADENGFVPEGDHLPTPPPIPAAILRSLEYQKSLGKL